MASLKLEAMLEAKVPGSSKVCTTHIMVETGFMAILQMGEDLLRMYHLERSTKIRRECDVDSTTEISTCVRKRLQPSQGWRSQTQEGLI